MNPKRTIKKLFLAVILIALIPFMALADTLTGKGIFCERIIENFFSLDPKKLEDLLKKPENIFKKELSSFVGFFFVRTAATMTNSSYKGVSLSRFVKSKNQIKAIHVEDYRYGIFVDYIEWPMNLYFPPSPLNLTASARLNRKTLYLLIEPLKSQAFPKGFSALQGGYKCDVFKDKNTFDQKVNAVQSSLQLVYDKIRLRPLLRKENRF